MAGVEVLAVIGIGASVVQVIDGCNKVLNRIRNYRQNMAFQDIELQLPLLMKDIESLSLPEYRELIDEATEKALVRVLAGCHRQIIALDHLIQRLSPAATASKLQRTWKGIKSFGKDTKLREILGILAEYKVTIILHLSSRRLRASNIAATTGKPPRSYFEVSAQRISHFIGRKAVLDKIEGDIATSEANPTVIAIIGFGGQGKTQLAHEFCHKSMPDFHTIFWIDASSRESAMRSFESIALKLSSASQSFSDPDSKLDFVKDALRNWPERWLLVFDNYDDPRTFNDITSFFPTSGGLGKNTILVTSRHSLSERLGIAIKLGGFSEDEALELLRSRCSSDSQSEEELEVGREIVKRLGYLPLAIDQAAAYISIRQLPFKVFLEHYEKRKDVILSHTPASLWEYRTRGDDATKKSELNLSVLTTWELSFEQIGDNDGERDSIGQFLTQSAFFNPASISESLFRSFFTGCQRYGESPPSWMASFSSGEAWDSFKFQDVVVGLMNLSLIQSIDITSQEMKFSMHPLVKDWLQLRKFQVERCQCTFTAITICHYLIQEQDVEAIPVQTRQETLGHIDTCMENYSNFPKDPIYKKNYGGLVEGLQTTFATFYGRHDRYADAERLFMESLEWQDHELGQQDLATLRTMNNLAAMYLDVRELPKAERLLLKTLTAKETLVGSDNPVTLNTVNNHGNLYAMRSLFDQATKMYMRTLRGYAELYGPTHKTVIEAQNNIGEVAMKIEQYEEAESRFKMALSRLPSSEENGLSLYVKSNIAVTYKLQGRYQEAIELYEEVIRGRGFLHGPDHSATLISMRELGDVYCTFGQQDKAEEWYSRGKADTEWRRKGPMERRTLEESPVRITTGSVDMLEQNSTPIPAKKPQQNPNHQHLKWDDPTIQRPGGQIERSGLSERNSFPPPAPKINRSGRHRQNQIAQEAFKKGRRENLERLSTADNFDPETGTKLMNNAGADEVAQARSTEATEMKGLTSPECYSKSKSENFWDQGLDQDLLGTELCSGHSTYHSSTQGRPIGYEDGYAHNISHPPKRQRDNTANKLPKHHFHRPHMYNADEDEYDDEDEGEIQKPSFTSIDNSIGHQVHPQRRRPPVDPESDKWNDIPDRRGRALRNKELALSRLSRVFQVVEEANGRSGEMSTTLLGPTLRSGIPNTCPSRAINLATDSPMYDDVLRPSLTDETHTPFRSGAGHANERLVLPSFRDLVGTTVDLAVDCFTEADPEMHRAKNSWTARSPKVESDFQPNSLQGSTTPTLREGVDSLAPKSRDEVRIVGSDTRSGLGKVKPNYPPGRDQYNIPLYSRTEMINPPGAPGRVDAASQHHHNTLEPQLANLKLQSFAFPNRAPISLSNNYHSPRFSPPTPPKSDWVPQPRPWTQPQGSVDMTEESNDTVLPEKGG